MDGENVNYLIIILIALSLDAQFVLCTNLKCNKRSSWSLRQIKKFEKHVRIAI